MHGSRERQSGSTRTGRNRKFRFRNDTTSCYHASKLVDMRPVPWQTTIVRYRKRLCFRSVVEKSCKENDLQRQSLTSPPKRRRTTPIFGVIASCCPVMPHITAKTTADYTPFWSQPSSVACASHHRQNDGGLHPTPAANVISARLTSPPKRRRTTPYAQRGHGRKNDGPHITAKTTADYTHG